METCIYLRSSFSIIYDSSPKQKARAVPKIAPGLPPTRDIPTFTNTKPKKGVGVEKLVRTECPMASHNMRRTTIGMPFVGVMKRMDDTTEDSVDTSSECSSIFSMRTRCEYWQDGDDLESSCNIFASDLSLQEMWSQLEEKYTFRNRLFSSIAKGKSPRTVRVLWEEEARLRRFERTQLLRSYFEDNSCIDFEHDLEGLPWRPLPLEPLSWRETLDSWTTEARFLGSTVVGLTLHSLTHIGLYGISSSLIQNFSKPYDGQYLEHVLYLVAFAVGVTGMRFSTYLYWWSNHETYDCMKFSYHNRLRLGRFGARLMVWIRERPMLQAMLCLVGYDLVYLSITFFYWMYFIPLFDERDRVLDELPSYSDEAWHSTGRTFDAFVDHVERFIEADLLFTWKALSYDSFLEYWGAKDSMYGDEETAAVVMSGRNELLCYVSTVVLAMWLLCKHGVVFWEKF